MQLIGYKMKGQDPGSIQVVLGEMRKRTCTILKKHYKKLLQDEIESVFDETALLMVERPNIPILLAARDTLNQKVFAGNLHILYNFMVSTHLFFFEGDSYFQIHVDGKWMFDGSFSKIPGICPYHVRSVADVEFEVGQYWQRIMRYAEEHEPLGAIIFRPEKLLEFDAEAMVRHMKFHSVSERAQMRARHQVMNSILGSISNGNIPNYKLMPYMDIVLSCLQEEDVKEKIKEESIRLMQILPEIKKEDVIRDPIQKLEQNEEEKHEEE